MAKAFLAALPAESTCIICLEIFGKSPSENIPPEHAVRLPCSHIVGNACIANWLNPEGTRKKTCLHCRYKLFELPTLRLLPGGVEVDRHPADFVRFGISPKDHERIRPAIRPANTGLFAITHSHRGVFGFEPLELYLHRTPAGHPRHKLRRRELELYERLRREGADLSEPDLTDSGALHSRPENEQWGELGRRGAFDVVPEFVREEDRWYAWEDLQWEGYVWCPGPGENGEGRENGWYLD